MSVLSLLAVAAGMAILVFGAEALVRGAARLATAAGVSSLVIGLTVVAYGTSAPEMAVSVNAAVSGAGDVAVGNAVGSNIFNILAILGISALFGGLVVHQRLVKVDVPILLGVTLATWWAASDGTISVLEGALMFAGIVLYSAGAYILGRREPPEVEAEYDEAIGDKAAAVRAWPRAVGLVLGGLVALVIGSQLLVTGAVDLAEALGISELIIGLTVVAAGTSLPELATSVVATRHGERDIAVGNIVGSNIFNLLAVMGASAMAGGGLPVPQATISTDLPVSLLVTLVALPALALGLYVSRWEGVVLLVGYITYVGYLILDGTASPSAPTARVWLLVGLGVAALAILVVGVLQGRRSDATPRAG